VKAGTGGRGRNLPGMDCNASYALRLAHSTIDSTAGLEEAFRGVVNVPISPRPTMEICSPVAMTPTYESPTSLRAGCDSRMESAWFVRSRRHGLV
jgi:hypothetical protein